LKLSQEFISSLLHKTGFTQFTYSVFSRNIVDTSRSDENSIKNSFQLKYNYQYFFTITGSKSDWKRREVVLSRGYGHIQQSLVRAEVFAGKMNDLICQNIYIFLIFA
jgi:hypothetical protein